MDNYKNKLDDLVDQYVLNMNKELNSSLLARVVETVEGSTTTISVYIGMFRIARASISGSNRHQKRVSEECYMECYKSMINTLMFGAKHFVEVEDSYDTESSKTVCADAITIYEYYKEKLNG